MTKMLRTEGTVGARPWTRRALIAVAAVAGASGCGLSFDSQVANDPYITLIKQDPMFSWRPPGDLHREVSYVPLRPQPLASQSSTVAVIYSVLNAATIPELIQMAHDASLAYGYDETGRRQDASGTTIRLDIDAAATPQGLALLFRAPMS